MHYRNLYYTVVLHLFVVSLVWISSANLSGQTRSNKRSADKNGPAGHRAPRNLDEYFSEIAGEVPEFARL